MPNFDFSDSPESTETSPSHQSMDWHGIAQVLVDKSWLIIACTVVVLIIAVVYVKKAPTVYEAVTTVQVEQEDAKIIKAEQVVSEDMRGLETLNTVADKLCNAALLQRVLAINGLLPAEGSSITNGSVKVTREEAIRRFARNVKATLRRNTRLIDITARNEDPRLAAKLANSLVENYLEQDAQAQFTTTEMANNFLQREAEKQEKQLQTSDQAVQDYRRQAGFVSLDQTQDIITPQLQDLNRHLTELRASVLQAQADYDESLKMSTNTGLEGLLAYPQIATNPDVIQIAAEVAQHENDFIVIRQRYREKNPKYIVAQASLNALRQQLAATVDRVRSRIQESRRIAYENAQASETKLVAELQRVETNAMQLSDASVRFHLLSRQLESDKIQYDSVISRLGETAVAAHITPERIRVIQPATVPERPAAPKVKLILALALFGGLSLGFGLSFTIEAIDSSVRTVEEAEGCFGLPVLASIPRLSKAEFQQGKIAAAGDRDSAGVEMFRTLRTTLSMLGREKDRKTFLFTSALPGEGKTFASINYAVSLAQQGLRTVVLDMDLRRPMLEEFFLGKCTPLPGVTDYFLGRKKFDEICLPHQDIKNLSWVSAGNFVPNPLELLAQSNFQQLLNEALARFDRVVIDTVPILPVSDALLIVDKVQTVILIVQGSKTPRNAVQRSLQLLKKANAPLSGIVLNLLPTRLFNGHYYYAYHPYSHAAREVLPVK